MAGPSGTERGGAGCKEPVAHTLHVAGREQWEPLRATTTGTRSASPDRLTVPATANARATGPV